MYSQIKSLACLLPRLWEEKAWGMQVLSLEYPSIPQSGMGFIPIAFEVGNECFYARWKRCMMYFLLKIAWGSLKT